MRSAPRSWLMIVCAALAGGCSERENGAAPDSAPTRQEETAALPIAEPPLDRAAMLLAIGRAASGFAAGRDDTARQRQLEGNRFELRLRFGCDDDPAEAHRSSFDEGTRVLRIRVVPEITAATPLVAGLELTGMEAVEGFWIARDWLLEPACPRAPTRAEAPAAETARPTPSEADAAPANPRIGIVQFFTADDARTQRRNDRAYEATVTLADDEAPSESGYDVVLAGRLAALPGGRVIACSGEGHEEPPSCLVSARFDQVSLTRAGEEEVIADWTRG